MQTEENSTVGSTQATPGFSRWRFLLGHAGAFLFLSTILRAVLALGFRPTSAVSAGDWIRAFAVGLHFDVAMTAVLFVPLAWLTGILAPRVWISWHRMWLSLVLFIAWAVLCFVLIGEGYFFEEFRSRYNTVAIDYLIYPHEVFVNIWDTYNVPVVIGTIVVLATMMVWRGWRVARVRTATGVVGARWRPALGWTAIAVALGATVRIEEARFSSERTINEIANNTFVSVLTAAFTRNLDYAQFYPTMPRDEAYARARKLVATPDATYSGPADSLQRKIAGDGSRPRLNVMLLLEESLGSEFWGSLGRPGASLTPQLDRIAAEEGLLFDNLYADGNRTIRGYEGVFCSFPPLPGDAIVARDRSEHIETVARALARDGYDTTFVYAGRGLFDGTRPFTTANGWSNFVELKDFKSPEFTTVWGVCNEDLYKRAIEEARDRHAKGLPFFLTTMSVSNHKPYTYPAGHIAENPLEKTRENVVKYSDYALGRFFEMARKEAYWTNTIFVVIADHGARVYGSQTIPIRSYEIPMLVVGPAVVPKPARASMLGCQLDVAPTLLGMIGRPYESVFFGRDLLRHPTMPGRVLLNHNRSIGIYSDQRLVVFSLNRKVEYFRGDPKVGQMERATEPDATMRELEMDATALFQIGDELYMNRRFRLP